MTVTHGVRDAIPGLDRVSIDEIEAEGTGDTIELRVEGGELGGGEGVVDVEGSVAERDVAEGSRVRDRSGEYSCCEGKNGGWCHNLHGAE